MMKAEQTPGCSTKSDGFEPTQPAAAVEGNHMTGYRFWHAGALFIERMPIHSSMFFHGF